MTNNLSFAAWALLLAAALVAPAAEAAATDTDPPSLIGKWAGRADNGDKVTYTFAKDGSLQWTVEINGASTTMTGKYVIDRATRPAHLDITELSAPAPKDFVFLGLLEFEGPARFKLFGAPGLRAETKRPSAFTAEAIVFSRSK